MLNWNSSRRWRAVAALFLCGPSPIFGNRADFNEVVAKLESDALEFRDVVQDLHAQRCSTINITSCTSSNYDNCLTALPNPVCPSGDELFSGTCGDGVVCSAYIDRNVSCIRLPELVADGVNLNPTDPQVIETICFSQQLDDWFVQKYQDDYEFWQTRDLPHPQMFYGSNDGTFRIYPARLSENCGRFDTRTRPWYGAGSTGNKNIVLVLDISGSMEGLRILLLKEAAKQIIQRLGIGDRVAIVPFNSQAFAIAEDNLYLYVATQENKDALSKMIDGLESSGGTNFKYAFAKAFDIMKKSIEEEAVKCNAAFLFLTDGEQSEPENVTEAEVLSFVKDGLDEIQSKLGRPPLLFTYSLSENGDVHLFPKRLACEAAEYGVWSKITDPNNLVESLNSYYLLLAMSLGHEDNRNHTTWCEPYPYDFSTVIGITVSAAVHDYSKGYPIFLGVVGIDFPLSAINQALGVPDGSDEAIQLIVLESARCPSLELTAEQLASFQQRGSAGADAVCDSNMTAYMNLEDELCLFASDYPEQVFVPPTYNESMSYAEKSDGCCGIANWTDQQCAAIDWTATASPSAAPAEASTLLPTIPKSFAPAGNESSPFGTMSNETKDGNVDDGISTGAIAGIAVGSAVVGAVGLLVFVWCCCSRDDDVAPPRYREPTAPLEDGGDGVPVMAKAEAPAMTHAKVVEEEEALGRHGYEYPPPILPKPATAVLNTY